MGEDQASTRAKRVLTCDDEPAVTRILERFLSFCGFSVTTLNDPREVLPTLDAGNFDLLILDLLMPHLTGDQVLDALREREPYAELPVLVLTAKQLDPRERASFRRSRAAVIQKPFQLHELIQRVRQAVTK